MSSVVQLLLDAICLFDHEGEEDTRDVDRRCTTAVEMFVSLSVSIEQQAVVGKMLPRFLSYVMEVKCNADKAATLADLLRAVDISMTSNVTVLEKVLMISCFHPDITVQERYMDHLTSSAVVCCCLAQRQEDDEALQWWTGRCLPTWIDVLTHGIAEGAEISSGSKHSNISHVLGQLMVNQSPLRADGINMPLFVVAMIDGGGHTKLMSIIEALPSGSAWKGELKSLYHKATVPENQFLSTDNIEKLRFVPWSWKNHSGFTKPRVKWPGSSWSSWQRWGPTLPQNGCREEHIKGLAEHLPGLLHLTVDTQKPSGGILRLLTRFSKLQTLRLQGATITDVGMHAISLLRSLTHLDLSRCRGFSSSGVGCLAKVPVLDTLNVHRSHWISIEVMAQISNIATLTSLGMSESSIGVTPAHLLHLQKLRQLQTLNLSVHKCINVEVVEALLTKTPNLTSLNLSHSPHMPSGAVKRLSHLAHLTHLDVSWCQGLPTSGVEHLLTHAKSLKRLMLVFFNDADLCFDEDAIGVQLADSPSFRQEIMRHISDEALQRDE